MSSNRFLSVPIEDLSQEALNELRLAINAAIDPIDPILPNIKDLPRVFWDMLTLKEQALFKQADLNYTITEKVDIEFNFCYGDGPDNHDCDYYPDATNETFKAALKKHKELDKMILAKYVELFKDKYKTKLQDYFGVTITQKMFTDIFNPQDYID